MQNNPKPTPKPTRSTFPTEDHSRNGVILWEGNGSDKKPLVLICTGLVSPSENPKTGPMLQTWLMRADLHPMEAAKIGADKSVCNNCELRMFTVKPLRLADLELKPTVRPQCYVSLTTVAAVWRTYRQGRYANITRSDFPAVFGGRLVRLGSYGNLSNVPLWVVRAVVEGSAGWTMYDHNWHVGRAQGLREYAMASVSTVEAKEEAQRLGWRTFRVSQTVKDVQPDEVRCPASPEGGKKATCASCQLCRGNSLKAKSVVIVDHGPTSTQRKELIQLGRISRGQVHPGVH